MILELLNFTGTDSLIKRCLDLRFEVFVQEQKVDKFLEFDGLDDVCIHYLIEADGIPVATCRWRETSEGIKIERFAVKNNFRSKSIGSVLLKYVLDDIKAGSKDVYIHAQFDAIKFWEMNKFVTSGNSFSEAGITHFKMFYKK